MTRLIVLGLLDIQPMSGYDIQQMIKLTDAERWGGVLIGSIYHALKKMEAEGYVEVTSIESTGHRQKAVYRITDEGRTYLKELAKDTLQAPSVQYPSTLYSALSYVEKLPRDEALQALRSQADSLRQEIEELEAGQAAKREALNGTIPGMTQLIFDHMFMTVRQQLALIESAIEQLDA